MPLEHNRAICFADFLRDNNINYIEYLNLIKELYVDERFSADMISKQIKEMGYSITTRSIQRTLKKMGVIRTGSQAFKLAVDEGRMSYPKKGFKKERKTLPRGLRYQILQRDSFKCKACGNTSKETILEVDHIDEDPTNNDPKNLQTLCYKCNIGKSKKKLI